MIFDDKDNRPIVWFRIYIPGANWWAKCKPGGNQHREILHTNGQGHKPANIFLQRNKM